MKTMLHEGANRVKCLQSSRHTPCAVRHSAERIRALTVKQRHTACAYYFERNVALDPFAGMHSDGGEV
jgi:hypothetical protein